MTPLRTLLICLFLILNVGPGAGGKDEIADSPSEKEFLIVQWESSRPRVVESDFRYISTGQSRTVGQIVSFQPGETRLGWFQSLMNCELESILWNADLFYWHVRNWSPMSERLQNMIAAELRGRRGNPLGPVARLSDEELRAGQPYFGPVTAIVQRVWEFKNAQGHVLHVRCVGERAMSLYLQPESCWLGMIKVGTSGNRYTRWI